MGCIFRAWNMVVAVAVQYVGSSFFYPQSVKQLHSRSHIDWVLPLLLVLTPLYRLGVSGKPLAPPSGDSENNRAADPKSEARV